MVIVQRVKITEGFCIEIFLAGAGNAAVIVVPRPYLDRFHGGTKEQTGNKPGSQVPEWFF